MAEFNINIDENLIPKSKLKIFNTNDRDYEHYAGENQEHLFELLTYLIVSFSIFFVCIATLYLVPVGGKLFKKIFKKIFKRNPTLAMFHTLPELREQMPEPAGFFSEHFPMAEFGVLIAMFLVVKIIVGLFLHSVLTGLSIGLLGNDSLVPGVLALIPHKVAVLLLLSTMGLEINPRSRFVHFMIFSAALPAGILISMSISTVKNVTALCVVEALGCGAIFYVAILEMLPQAINQGGFKMLKYLIVLVGITCIAVLQLSHSHAHGHDHGDHDHGHHDHEHHEHDHEVPNLS